jgi:N-acetylglucosamine kinase-like BadF-type ATPase
MRYVIGMDSGGTKTVGLLADENGVVIREARGGGGNLLVHGELGVEKSLYQVLEALDPPAPVAVLCIGIAGVARPAEREVIQGVLRRLGFRHTRLRIENDAFVALVAGAPAGHGIVVIAGTGSIAYGVDPGGKTARSGGWGYLLGDEGSAFWLGHAAVRQGIRSADGRGPKTLLFELICDKLGISDPPGLVAWFYDQELSRYRVAQLASLVEQAANAGDEAAEALLVQAADHLIRAARAVERQLDLGESYPLVLSGGAFKACPSLVGRIEAGLELPRARVVRLAVEPAVGAVTLALAVLDPASTTRGAGD